MPPKTKSPLGSAKAKNSKLAVTKNGKDGDKSGKGGKTTKKKSQFKEKTDSMNKGGRQPVDILSRTAMENAYYICHNAQDLLHYRGYRWPQANKKGKGKKGKK